MQQIGAFALERFSHWPRKARLLRDGEPERGLRVMRLLFANRPTQCDKSESDRPAVASTRPLIYADDPSAPRAARRLPPEELREWAETAAVLMLDATRWNSFNSKLEEKVAEERNMQARLLKTLAEQLDRREHGRPPKFDRDSTVP